MIQNLTIEEQERAAYMAGNVDQANLLGRLADAEEAVDGHEEALETEREESYTAGYEAGREEGIGEGKEEAVRVILLILDGDEPPAEKLRKITYAIENEL
jgi:flagellar biosynthesis/type III secretory pathway protein FliH